MAVSNNADLTATVTSVNNEFIVTFGEGHTTPPTHTHKHMKSYKSVTKTQMPFGRSFMKLNT